MSNGIQMAASTGAVAPCFALNQSGRLVISATLWFRGDVVFGNDSGEWEDGLWHGTGRLELAEGEVYEGGWMHGVK